MSIPLSFLIFSAQLARLFRYSFANESSMKERVGRFRNQVEILSGAHFGKQHAFDCMPPFWHLFVVHRHVVGPWL